MLFRSVLGHRPRKADVDSMNPQRPGIRRARNAMRMLEDAHARDLAALLERLPRPTRHVLLQPNRVPDLDRAVLGSCRKEELVGRDLDVGDGARVLDEVGDEGTFGTLGSSFARREARAERLATRDADWDMRAEFGKGFAVVVEVDSLEKLLDAGIVALCENEIGRAHV